LRFPRTFELEVHNLRASSITLSYICLGALLDPI
jgi:hypothetical protein